jgi:hypothetical protein
MQMPVTTWYTQYVAADDAAAGNSLNNASYQRATVVSAINVSQDSCTGSDPQRFCAILTDSIHDTESPIRAWKNEDPSVIETDAPVPGEGLFTLAAKVTDLGTGLWRYEYALQNLNSDRSGRALTIPVAIGSSVSNVGFHDVEYHSGEPIDNADWEANVLSGKIIWTTQDYAVNINANALRWGTLYNFRFDTTAPPTPPGGYTTVVLDLSSPALQTRSASTRWADHRLHRYNSNGIAGPATWIAAESVTARHAARQRLQPQRA